MTFNSYQKLSLKTYFITLLQKSSVPIMVSVVWVGLVFIKTLNLQSIIDLPNSADLISFITKVLDLGLVLGVVIIIISWLIAIIGTLIRHLTFQFMLDEHGISIKQGLIHKVETMTSYRHIENVDIQQPLLYQLLGMCILHIITGVEEDGNKHGHLSEIEFPVIEKSLADDIKDELFTRLNNVIGNKF
jgi:putative membrane protein